jgi:hypothetical protein
MLWGYSARHTEKVLEENASAGTNTLQGTAIASGEVFVLQGVSAKDITTGPTSIRLYLNDGTVQPTLAYTASPGAGIDCYWSGAIVLAAGDKVVARLEGCTLNDNIVMHYWGYRMDIDL